jgi:hypothetical protein
MLVVVAIDAQQLPVAAIRGIVVVIVVLMVNGQLAQRLALEFAGTAGADMGEELQRPLSVTGLPLLFFPAHLRDQLRLPVSGTVFRGVCHFSLTPALFLAATSCRKFP